MTPVSIAPQRLGSSPSVIGMDLHWAGRRRLRDLPYAEFLKSEFWRRVSGAVKCRAGWRCELCYGAHYLEAHHKSYKNHGSEDLYSGDLICLCSDCHGKFRDRLIDPCRTLKSIEPEGPIPTSPSARVRWMKRNMALYLAPKAMELLVSYARDSGGTLEYIPRLKTKLAGDLGIKVNSIGLVLDHLQRLGKIQDAVTAPRLCGGPVR